MNCLNPTALPWRTQPLTDRDAAARVVSAVLTEAALHDVILDFAPPPEPQGCCGRGCNGCVWEGFFAALNYWREEADLKLPPATAACPG